MGTTVVFTLWLAWLWMDEGQTVKIEKPKQFKVQEIVKVQQESKPSVFILPAPPTPAPNPIEQTPTQIEPVRAKSSPIVEVKVEKDKATPSPESPVKIKPVTKPVLKEKVKPPVKPVQKTHQISQTDAVNGRVLLRVLEHGKGPQIEIAWPSKARERDGLYRQFQNCFAMVNALMDGKGNLFRKTEARGVRWEINMDRFSGFLRQASGQLPTAEQRVMRSISQRHRMITDPRPVRIFPRHVDASLLGGLRNVIGDGYMSAHSIQARYVLDKGRVLIQDIYVDGKTKAGVIKLSPAKRCRGQA